jgi:hypothetical protein
MLNHLKINRNDLLLADFCGDSRHFGEAVLQKSEARQI